jgi:PPP family 3-phenylpropionic acid transporter
LRDPELRLVLGAAMLAQMAMATYDSCFSLHLARLGFGGSFIGVAWAIGVAAEIALMAASHRLLARVGAAPLFALSIAVAAARWLMLAELTSGPAILLLQPLHAISFGLFWITAVTLARQRGHALPSAAQGLLASAMGVGGLVGMSLAGRLLEAGGGRLLYRAAFACSVGATLFAFKYAWHARSSEYARAT